MTSGANCRVSREKNPDSSSELVQMTACSVISASTAAEFQLKRRRL